MSNYTTGTIDVVQGQVTVSGLNTDWATGLVEGGVLFTSGGSYPIASVESDTSLTLEFAFAGATVSNQAYVIQRFSEAAKISVANVSRLATLLNQIDLGTVDGNIIWHENNNGIVGQVAYFAVSTAPAGWLKANGAAVSRTVYASLFERIGTTFGVGDGSTTFNLPDLRGEFLRGFDDGRGVDTSRALGSLQGNDIQSHGHDVEGPAGHSHGTEFGSGTVSATFSYIPDTVFGSGAYQDTWKAANAGGSETRPRNIAMLACIKY